jgi:hypothetical protein
MIAADRPGNGIAVQSDIGAVGNVADPVMAAGEGIYWGCRGRSNPLVGHCRCVS